MTSAFAISCATPAEARASSSISTRARELRVISQLPLPDSPGLYPSKATRHPKWLGAALSPRSFFDNRFGRLDRDGALRRAAAEPHLLCNTIKKERDIARALRCVRFVRRRLSAAGR